MYAHTYNIHGFTRILINIHKTLQFPQLDTNAVTTNTETSTHPDPNV